MFNLMPWRKNQETAGDLVTTKGNPFAGFRKEFNALFDRFFPRGPIPFWPKQMEEFARGSSWGMDMEDKEEEVVVKAELPGLSPEDLDVQVSGNLLTIKADQKQEGKTGNGQFAEHRSFRRTVSLPPGTEADKVEARYRNGLLEVHLPQSEEAKGKRIEVKA